MAPFVVIDPYSYGLPDFSFESAPGITSQFDDNLCSIWDINMGYKSNIFRYQYKDNLVKKIPGDYQFHAELNELRGQMRRIPEHVTSVTKPFSYEKFNFGNIDQNEELFHVVPDHWTIGEGTSPDFDEYRNPLIINSAPIGYGSSLLVPSIDKHLPQALNFDAIRLAVEIALISHNVSLRMGMNSLGGAASVNHLHFHLYYLTEELYLQYAPVKKLLGRCYITDHYPAQAFVFQIGKREHILPVIQSIMKIVKVLQENDIAHNIFITRGTAFDEESEIIPDIFQVVRVYIWARKSYFGVKSGHKLVFGFCELSGHLIFTNKELFESVTEANVTDLMHDICDDPFLRARQLLLNRYINF